MQTKLLTNPSHFILSTLNEVIFTWEIPKGDLREKTIHNVKRLSKKVTWSKESRLSKDKDEGPQGEGGAAGVGVWGEQCREEEEKRKQCIGLEIWVVEREEAHEGVERNDKGGEEFEYMGSPPRFSKPKYLMERPRRSPHLEKKQARFQGLTGRARKGPLRIDFSNRMEKIEAQLAIEIVQDSGAECGKP